MSRERGGRGGAEFRRIADISSIGLAFPIAILIGFFFGRWLDGIFGTPPWLMIVFSVMGIAAGFLNAIRTGLRVGREEDAAGKPPGRGA